MQLPIPGTAVTWHSELPPAHADSISLGKYCHVRHGELTIDMPGVARYRITGGTLIEVALFPGAEHSLAEFFLMTTPFGALIHQRGELALHASAVVSPLSGKALLIAGSSGAGKSTVAAALAARGWTVMNDDVSRITLEGKEPVVWPGFQSLKLWRQSCKLLDLDSDALTRTRGGKEKYFWPGKASTQSHPAPIAAVIELVPSDEAPAGLERLMGREVLGTYLRLTFRQRLVEGLGCQVPHFQHAGRLAASVPTYRLRACRQVGLHVLAEQLEHLLMETAPT